MPLPSGGMETGMKNWVKGHKKILILCGIVLAALIALLAVWQRQEFKKNSIGNTMPNPPRSEESFIDTFYLDQLTEREKDAYDAMKTALDEYKGGEVIFPEPLTGLEFTRAYNALEYGADDYFYGMIGIPMTEEDQNLAYKNDDIQLVEDPLIQKCLLFLYCSEGVDINGSIDEDGYVTNLEELKDPLAAINEERMAEVQNIQEERDAVLNQVVADMPAEYGAKEAIDYFLGWMDENLILQQPSEQSQGITSMSDFFTNLNFKSHLSCVAAKNAFASGYGRVLSDLCNRAGIPSHVVMGVWSSGFMGSSQESYMLTCVEIEGEPIYVDASGSHKKQLLDQRYITEEGAMNWMDFVDYFTYGEE